MAKKRRQKEEKKDDTDFKFPEFDEVKFIKKEFTKAKVAFITAGYALLFGIISYALLHTLGLDNWQVPVIIGFFAVFTLPLLFNQIKMDLSDYELKSWIGAGAIYFFIWLAVFIVLCNPPFSDFAEPEIEPIIYINDSTSNEYVWTEPNTSGGIHEVPISNDMKISAKIHDNWKLDEDSIRITLIDPLNNENTTPMVDVGDAEYIIIYPRDTLLPGNYKFTIVAEDDAGHKAVYSGAFKVK
ncbi:MAG: hypothetical protein KAJ51_01930 [Thermoplasmata archaeon]|nr:hypothetical protein [Thermoplasmata archaeon]